MKTNKLSILLVAIIAISISSCTKTFEKYTQNPNQPTSVPAYLLLRQIENNIFVAPGNDEEKWSQYTLSTYTYYGTNEYWTGSASLNYNTLQNVVAMEKEAAKASANATDITPYSALAKFFKAYIYINMSMKVGDIPMSESLKGLANPTPKYDTQKQVFVQSLQLLEEANSQLATLIANSNTALLGDFYFQDKISGGVDPLTALKK
jgi:Starch-binding associating with outer membrane